MVARMELTVIWCEGNNGGTVRGDKVEVSIIQDF